MGSRDYRAPSARRCNQAQTRCEGLSGKIMALQLSEAVVNVPLAAPWLREFQEAIGRDLQNELPGFSPL